VADNASGASEVSARTVFTQMRRHLPPSMALAARVTGGGAVEVAACGATVELSDGRRVLDFGSYAVTLLGHRHPAVTAAVHRQLDVLPTSTRTLANPVTAAAAATLVEYLGGALPRVCFGANGADAVEAVLKLSRMATGRPRVLAVAGGFHGKSLGALALTHEPRFRAGLAAHLPHVTHVSPEDPEAVAREVARGDVAAVVFEPVQGESGVRPIEPAVLGAWCAAAAARDVFVVADEIQCGLRRYGPRSVALELGLPVDAVLLGKPLGGGVLPLSALVCSDALYAPLVADPTVHTATFAGHPLACAALPAALAAIEEAAARGPVIGSAMAEGLAAVRRARPGVVREVRGAGLLWGVELISAEVTGKVIVELSRRGLLVSPCMSRPETLRLLPPLVVTDEEVRAALGLLDAALGAVEASAAPAATPVRA